MALQSADSDRVYLLMFNAWGRGGVARTVINLANRLAQRHRVELVSLFQRPGRPPYTIDPRVRVTALAGVGAGAEGEHGPLRSYLHSKPSLLRPFPVETRMSLLTDYLLWRKLRTLRPGVLVSTRPSLHLAAVRYAPRHVATVGQDHLNYPARFRNAPQARVLRAAVPRLDAYTVLTNADAEDYARDLPGSAGSIRVIRNALPWPVSPAPAALEAKVIVSAGRLAPEKGFPRLIRAFEPVAREHPDWRLHIYGQGDQRAALESLVAERRLGAQVELKGYTRDFRSALSRASLYAMGSHEEGFPMVLIEALSTGVPPVSFDCPRGPGEIIDDGKNGRLVPDGDVAGFSSALRELVEDAELRTRLGARALEDARQYEMDTVVEHWEALFAQVASARRG